MATNAELFGLSTFITAEKTNQSDKKAWEDALAKAYSVFSSESGTHKSILDFCVWAASPVEE